MSQTPQTQKRAIIVGAGPGGVTAAMLLASKGYRVAVYIAGLLMRSDSQRIISQVLLLMSGALLPIGLYVILYEANANVTNWTHFSIALAMLVLFTTAHIVSKRNITIVLMMAFVGLAYYAFLAHDGIISLIDEDEIFKFGSMILGAAYILFTYGYIKKLPISNPADAKEKRSVANLVYGVGTLLFLGGGILVGGLFDLILILFLFAGFYGGIYLKSRSVLTVSALFTMAHVGKITFEYFEDVIGWPIALMIIGFAIIGIGILTHRVSKKYIV